MGQPFGVSAESASGRMPITVSLRRPEPGLVVVSAAGEIDLGTVSVLEAALVEAQSIPSLVILIVDLDAVTFLDSSGIRALVVALKRAETAGTGLRVVSAARAVRRPLELVGLDATLRLFDTYDDALAEPQVS